MVKKAKSFWRRWVIRLTIFMVISLLAFVGVATMYVHQILYEANIAVLEEKTKNVIGPKTPQGESIYFKEGALVNKEEFRFFYQLTTESEDYQTFLSRMFSEGQLEEVSLTNKHFLVRKDFELKPLLKNDCVENFCFKHYVSFDFIPPLFWKGIIAVEDARYLEHSGVDYISLLRALWANLRSLRFSQGGSTISQQLVKNLFFTNEKTLIRKVNEIIVTFYVEKKFPKEKILEAYLNEFQWGGLQGMRIKGFYSASLFYFQKRPEDLTPYEIAILVSLLKGPNYFSPLTHVDRLKERANIVIGKMLEKNEVAKSDQLIWGDKEWGRFLQNLKAQNQKRFFLQYYKAEQTRLSHVRSQDALKNIGLDINPYEQFVLAVKVQEVRSQISERFKEQKIDFAVKVLIRELLPTIKDDPSLTSTHKDFSYYSKVERNLEKAIVNERHQVGSTVKPLVYNLLTKEQFSYDDKVSLLPLTLNLKSGAWSPKEASQLQSPEEETTLKTAIQKSYNRPVIHLANQFGFEKLEAGLLPFIPNLKTPLQEFPSQLLGSVEMSLGELAMSFEKFIRESCQQIQSGEKDPEETTLYVLSNPNETTVASKLDPLFKNLRFFGKTGTTNSGFDNWFVAYDGRFLTLLWVGNEGARNLGSSFSLYGSTTAFQIFQSFYRDRGQRFQSFSCDLLNGVVE